MFINVYTTSFFTYNIWNEGHKLDIKVTVGEHKVRDIHV